jgi:phosphatidylglycerophosphate synthase
VRTQIIREKTKRIVSFIAKPFIFLHFTPNMVSFLAIFAVIGFFPLLKNGFYYLAALMIVLNGIFDVIDGAVARATGKGSRFGKFLDRTLDKVSDAAILAAYMLYGLIGIKLGLYTLITMFLATNVSANIEGVLNLKISDAVSLRFVRIIILVLLTALQQFWAMFVILAGISTYALVYRFGAACFMHFRKGKR